MPLKHQNPFKTYKAKKEPKRLVKNTPLKASKTPKSTSKIGNGTSISKTKDKPLKTKREKKKTPKQLKKKCDELVSLIIRARDKRCVLCGNTEQLTNGHVFSRRATSTRWDITDNGNCHCQCWGCNFKHVRDQQPYFSWYINKFGYEEFLNLRKRFDETKQLKSNELCDLVYSLKSSLQATT